MVRIEKALPGELEGTFDPEEYGFGVVKQPSVSENDEAEDLASLYAKAKARTGVVMPKVERYVRERVR
jgi:hypothetical protein